MINIVIPMAGAGSRFSNSGYTKPKPFIDIDGIPMIARVLENLTIPNANFILVARREHLEAEHELVAEISRQYHATFIGIDALTEGTVCTLLYSHKLINNDMPLIVANSDQLIDLDLALFVKDCFARNLDGSILVFADEERNPKWSFVMLSSDGLVTRVKEKDPISKHATVGIYLYTKGSFFVDAAIQMVLRMDKVNNEYYTCPTYNYLIKDSRRIGVFEIDQNAMHGVGTPDDLNCYLDIVRARKRQLNNILPATFD